MIKRFYKSLFLIHTMLLLTNPSEAKDNSQDPIVLHNVVGPVIDASENDRFHLFSKDVGLIAARLYHPTKLKWVLHLVGEKNGKPWMLTPTLNERTRRRLSQRLLAGQNDDPENAPKFQEPVYTIVLAEEDFTEENLLQIKLTDGTKLIGKILAVSADSIRIVSVGGVKMDIPDNKILEVKRPEGEIVGGTFIRYDPNHVRLFFGPTGRTLKQGEAVFSDFYIFFPTIAFGVTDYFMIGGGFSLIPGADGQFFYISPKVRLYHYEKLDVAAGLVYMGGFETFGFGAVYTSISTGTPLGGVTVGLAVPFTTEEDSGLGNFISILFGGEAQVSNSLKLITENWLLSDGHDSLIIYSGGFRFIGEQLTVGFGFWRVEDNIAPWLDFSISFGK